MVQREFYGEVVVAGSCKQARAELAASEFDAAILDVALVNGDGISLYAEIKDKTPGTEVVFLTGYDSPDVRRRVEAVGAARVHSKSAMTDLGFIRDLLGKLGLRRRVMSADGI